MPLNGGTSEERHERQRAGMAQKETKMNNYAKWLNVVQSNASMGVDQNDIGAYRQNMLDTLRECGLPTYGALAAFARAVRSEKAKRTETTGEGSTSVVEGATALSYRVSIRGRS